MIDRFKQLLEQLHLSQSEFADKIGVQRSSVSHIMSGRNKPSIDFLEKILNVFPGVDATWLISGRASSQKEDISVNPVGENEMFITQNLPAVNKENIKPPAPVDEEPVAQIIIVYKNNTFRILNSSGK